MGQIQIIGGGLAGCEAAWQAAERGHSVILYEMRPYVMTGAHRGDRLAELVCSNSLGSRLPDRAGGMLKAELGEMRSMLLECAEATSVPAGTALAVDREAFAGMVTERIQHHERITVVREEVHQIPGDGIVVIATGPLTSERFSASITKMIGADFLFFYDAIAPILTIDSIDFSIAYRGARYDKTETGDYINCPLSKQQYQEFVEALVGAERIALRDFERDIESGVKAGMGNFFEGCMPVEVLARRGEKALAFGPMRPIGLHDPRTGKGAYAVVQLRQDNLAGDLYNMVGFQTNLTYSEQKRVFRLIPGLENAEFVRYGQMHKNTFIASPLVLESTLQYKNGSGLFFAGQVTGVEGYMGNIATGLLAGMNAARAAEGAELVVVPPETMLGALVHYITHVGMKDFQPMKANFGILPELRMTGRLDKRQRAAAFVERGRQILVDWMRDL